MTDMAARNGGPLLIGTDRGASALRALPFASLISPKFQPKGGSSEFLVFGSCGDMLHIARSCQLDAAEP